MMSLRLTPPLSLLFLLIGSGVVVSQYEWSVSYTPSYICALKGSTVIMGCSYTHPHGYTVQRGFWSRELVTDKEPPDLSLDPKYRGRVQYPGNTWGDCSLELSGVTEQDQGEYYFRFITTREGKYQGKDGVYLSIKELQVEMSPDSVVEGHDVTLTCKTTCRRTVTPTFTWYKTGHPLSFISSSNPLRLRSVSQSDAGSYSCAVQGESYRSPAVTLNVQYPPKTVSVSISPPGEIVEGSSVTLTCTSDANPPVELYTWYKGTSTIKTGKLYIISKISSVHSGDYTCQAANKHGRQSSGAVSLNVLYPPKSVSVSISPSGEIVEGRTVTLTCHSDANPPVEYNWFKGNVFKTKEIFYTINRINSEDSGEYRCKSKNQYGEKYSDKVTLNVLYPPKTVSVSISPSGEIVEGRTVTLSCSSDANPPAEYNWFKGTLFKSKGNTHTINSINSEDSGEYRCKSKNQHGEKYSDKVTLNVLYPPKNVSVSISPSGEIVEGSSVTLTCSSDANPPVELYTWYKVNESSPVGSGQSYSFTLSSNSSGWFYCVAQNKYGTQRAAAVPLTLNGSSRVVLYVVLGVMAGCGCLFAIIGVLYIRRKRSKDSTEDAKSNQENTYSSVNLSPAANNPATDPDQVPQDDVQYAVIHHRSDPRRAERSAGQTADSGAAEEVEYASVQPRQDRVVKKTEEDYDQYSNVRFNRTGAAYRSAAPPFEDSSVIYSS